MNEFEYQALLRRDLHSFVRKVFYMVAGNSSFQDNWHIYAICDNLMQAMEGRQKRLIINLPPRHLKSIMCSVALPAFILGHNPNERLICVSYADELSSKMALDCRKVMESDWYKEVFPKTRLLPERRSISDFETTAGGGRFSTSIGGVVTGRGGNYIIIDDPIKPSDSNSDVMREKVNNSYGTTLYSRLDDKKNGKIIVVMQRSHENDLTGYLLENDSSFKQIKMPIVAEEDEVWKVLDRSSKKEIIYERKVGDILHSERDSKEEIDKIKNNLGHYNFAGQYQQNPTSRGGNIIKREWLCFYNPKKFMEDVACGNIRVTHIIQSWDTACKIGETNDCSVRITAARVGDKIYILDLFREKLEFPALIKKANELIRQDLHKYQKLGCYRVNVIYEDVASGIGFGQALRGNPDIILCPITPTGDKETRILNISHLIENGTCLFPDENPAWWANFEREWIAFPNGKHDDQCDALSQLLSHLPRVSIFDVL